MSTPTAELGNYFAYKLINLLVGKTFKAILMQSGYTWNKATHKVYADISASELAGGSGYTTGGLALSGNTTAQDDVNDKGTLTFNDLTILPSGADLTFCGALIYNSTDNIICGFANAGGDVVAVDGVGYVLRNIIIGIAT